MKYLISYDISSDRKRNKVSRTLEDCGIRIQYSVFECELKKSEVHKLKKTLAKLINSKTDSIIIFPLCENCYDKKISVGLGYNIELMSFINIE